MKLTWHVQLENNARLIVEDGNVETEQHIEEQRSAVLAFLKDSGYDVVRCFGVLQQAANKEEK
jgi:copper chaperone CopZ